MNYHGYELEKHPKGGYVVRKDGELKTSQPSREFAIIWIDREIKKIKDYIE